MQSIYKIKAEWSHSIRWMIRRDMDEIVAIESASFDDPWDEATFIQCLRQRNNIGMVAEHGDILTGYMIYTLHKNRLEAINFAVHPDYRRRGVGRAMVDKLKSKLHPERRAKLEILIRDTNTAAHLFFKSQGFRCVEIVKTPFIDNDSDGYFFNYVAPHYDEAEGLGDQARWH